MTTIAAHGKPRCAIGRMRGAERSVARPCCTGRSCCARCSHAAVRLGAQRLAAQPRRDPLRPRRVASTPRHPGQLRTTVPDRGLRPVPRSTASSSRSSSSPATSWRRRPRVTHSPNWTSRASGSRSRGHGRDDGAVHHGVRHPVRDHRRLGLADTLTGIALPGAALPLSVFIMRQYALSIPDELLEAARIDGAGEFRIFFRIFLPLAGPAVATITIMSFLNSWNNFIWPLIVAQSTPVTRCRSGWPQPVRPPRTSPTTA